MKPFFFVKHVFDIRSERDERGEERRSKFLDCMPCTQLVDTGVGFQFCFFCEYKSGLVCDKARGETNKIDALASICNDECTPCNSNDAPRWQQRHSEKKSK